MQAAHLWIARGLAALAMTPAIGLAACGGADSPGTPADARPGAADAAPDASSGERLQLHILYVHGLKNCDEDRISAGDSFIDLEAAVAEELAARVAAYEAAHPGLTVVTSSARANLYTAEASGAQPTDSEPLAMDDWEVGAAGCAATRQGEPCTTAYEWRHRLAREIDRLFPADARNIILVGHSTGVRVSFEVAANVGPDGVGTQDFGVQHKIAGVIGIHGMVDALNDTDKYDMIGPFGFETTCKLGDLVSGIGGACTPGRGWCEYGGQLSAVDAADWVAVQKHALTLVSYHDCSPSAFGGQTDGSLPLAAQASPMIPGLRMTPAPGQTQQPAHGVQYGSFCHSAIDTRSNPLHEDAVIAAREHIIAWLFESALEVESYQSMDLSGVDYQDTTPPYTMAGECPAGHADAHVEVTGTCIHPGLFDGDDHVIDPAEFTVEDGDRCGGTFAWSQRHDPGDARDAVIHWKTYSAPPGAGVIDLLERD